MRGPVDFLVEHFTVLVIVGALVAVGVSQAHRGVGSLLGLALWVGVFFVGTEAYARGGAIGMAGVMFPRPAFWGICASLVVINLLGFVSWQRARRRQSPTQST